MAVEFIIKGPAYDVWTFSRDLCWAKIILQECKGKPLHVLYAIIRRGPAHYQLLPYMDKLWQMYLSTTRGLNP